MAVVRRTTGELAAGALQVNDSLDPEAELSRVFARHEAMHKSKTRDEFALIALNTKLSASGCACACHRKANRVKVSTPPG